MTPLYGQLGERLHAIASKAHKGDFDKQGKPYIEHYERVLGHVRRLAKERGCDDRTLDLALCAAAIHDVAEDHGLDRGMDLVFLQRQGIPAEVLEIVQLLTHDPADSYADYIVHLSKNPAAALAKLGDLADNSDPSRHPPGSARKQRYNLSAAFLNGQISEADYRASMVSFEKVRALTENRLERVVSVQGVAEERARVHSA